MGWRECRREAIVWLPLRTPPAALFGKIKVAEQANQRRQDVTRLGAIHLVEERLLDLLGNRPGDLALYGQYVACCQMI